MCCYVTAIFYIWMVVQFSSLRNYLPLQGDKHGRYCRVFCNNHCLEIYILLQCPNKKFRIKCICMHCSWERTFE